MPDLSKRCSRAAIGAQSKDKGSECWAYDAIDKGIGHEGAVISNP